MGRDKALLVAGNGLTFAVHLVNCFSRHGCNPVVLIVNEKTGTDHIARRNLVVAVNHQVALGRSWSIRLGLNHVPEGFSCFIHNVDNPYFDPDLPGRMLDMDQPGSYVVPVFNGRGGHPVLLGSQVADHLRSQDQPADFRQTLSRFQRIELPWPHEGILWNINTQQEYERYILASLR